MGLAPIQQLKKIGDELMTNQTFVQAIGLMQNMGFEHFLAPLLVFAVIFGVLQKTKTLGERIDLNAIIALVLALFVMLVPDASTFIFRLVPFFIVLTLVLFTGSILFLAMGVETKEITSFMQRKELVIAGVIILIVMILFTLSSIFGDLFVPQEQTGNASDYTGTTSRVFARILSHPKVIGTIVLLLLFGITTYVIVYQATLK